MNSHNTAIKMGGLITGPALFFLVILFFHPKELSSEAIAILASTLWIAIWWITEAIPIAVTALLPIILFPISGGMNSIITTSSYGHRYIFLFIGGFIISIAIEKWKLHKRIALTIIDLIGTNIKKIILGFMLATAFLSMWISNTATTVMMLPMGMAIISQLKSNKSVARSDVSKFSKALMLSIAYSASIGGLATLIGTPPNIVLAGVLQDTYNIEITFLQWFKLGLPISMTLLFISWKYLTGQAFKFELQTFPGGKEEIQRLKNELGLIKYEEKIVLIVFILTAVLWITRPIIQKFVPGIDDSIIALMSGVCLFILPGSKKGERILFWNEAVKMPWGIILLFGGGMALAQGFKTSGLAFWVGQQLSLFDGLSILVIVLILVTMVNFLTEITSNLATTAIILPILAPMALSLNIHPFILMVSATLAASCAFLLPVATPPNAIVFGSGHLRIPDMIRVGIWMNLISIGIITLAVFYVLPLFWNIELSNLP